MENQRGTEDEGEVEAGGHEEVSAEAPPEYQSYIADQITDRFDEVTDLEDEDLELVREITEDLEDAGASPETIELFQRLTGTYEEPDR